VYGPFYKGFLCGFGRIIPALSMSEALYASCAEVLSLCQSMKDDLAALLDPETGFAPRLRQICRDQLV